MKTKTQAFHDWIHEEKINQADFAAKTEIGLSTVASLITKSKHGIAITLRRKTMEKIEAGYPTCPLIATAGRL
jgi:hypothetical protein